MELIINYLSQPVGLVHYLILSSVIFVIGIFGLIYNKKNLIVVLLSLEVLLLAVNINLVAFSAYLQDLTGHVLTMFILTVAAAEAAIGLAIIVTYYRNKHNIEIEQISELKG